MFEGTAWGELWSLKPVSKASNGEILSLKDSLVFYFQVLSTQTISSAEKIFNKPF